MWHSGRRIATLLTMPMTSPSVLRCASAILAAVLLAGCTGEVAPAPTPTVTSASPQPSPAPTATSSATPTSTAVEAITTPPPVPADLTTPGQVGSKAAVEYFTALYGYALNSGDTSQLRETSVPTCGYCADLATNIEAHHAEATQINGGAATIEKIRLHEPESTEGRHLWLMHVVFSPSREIARNGQVKEKPEPRDDLMGLLAVWDGRSWRIDDYYDVTDDSGEES